LTRAKTPSDQSQRRTAVSPDISSALRSVNCAMALLFVGFGLVGLSPIQRSLT
jgi:hypothetical protein